MARTLILGVGNTLLSDEGAGVHALDYLRTHRCELAHTDLLDGGTLSLRNSTLLSLTVSCA